jgi:L-ascorbate metabolism protein UlaG (beta-lactamase superfamily)
MGIKFTWYGHAVLGLEIDKYKLIVDPFLTGNPAAKITPDKVQAEYILISHGHGDHIGDAIDIAKRTGATIITNNEIAHWFNSKGVDKTEGQHIGGGHMYPFGYLKLTQALHGSMLPDGSNGGNPCGFLITADKKKIYLACDTGLFGDMKLIGEEGIDLAVLPIGDYYTMGPDDALRATKMLQAKNIVPVHYNTFDLLKQDAGQWAQAVEKETGSKVHVLKPGDSFSL